MHSFNSVITFLLVLSNIVFIEGQYQWGDKITCWESATLNYTGAFDESWPLDNVTNSTNYTPGDVCDHAANGQSTRDACYFQVTVSKSKWKRSCIHHSECPLGNNTMGCTGNSNTTSGSIQCCCQADYCNEYMDLATMGLPPSSEVTPSPTTDVPPSIDTTNISEPTLAPTAVPSDLGSTTPGPTIPGTAVVTTQEATTSEPSSVTAIRTTEEASTSQPSSDLSSTTAGPTLETTNTDEPITTEQQVSTSEVNETGTIIVTEEFNITAISSSNVYSSIGAFSTTTNTDGTTKNEGNNGGNGGDDDDNTVTWIVVGVVIFVVVITFFVLGFCCYKYGNQEPNHNEFRDVDDDTGSETEALV